MFNLFAAIRIALMPGSEYAELVIAMINEKIIPEIDDRIKRAANNPEELENLKKVRELWVSFSDPASPDSRFWRNTSFSSLQSAIRVHYPKLAHLVSDIESEAVMKLIEDGDYLTHADKVDIMAGPKSFGGYWYGVVNKSALNVMRGIWNHMEEKHLGPRMEDLSDDEGESIPMLDKIKSPEFVDANVDMEIMEKVKARLDSRIERKFGENLIAMEVYRFWLDMIERKGPDEVVFKDDVVPPLMESLKQNRNLTEAQRVAKPSYLNALWVEIKKEIVRTLKDPSISRMTQKLRKKLKVAEVIAVENFTRRFANWVLAYHNLTP